VQHVPTLEVHITGLPLLPFFVTAKNEAALACPNKDHYLFAHDRLLSSETE
jgi:hypothetical protein